MVLWFKPWLVYRRRMWVKSHPWHNFFKVLFSKTCTGYATFSSVVPWNIPRVNFSVYTKALRQVCIPRKYNMQVGYSTVSHEKVLHNYFIPCHRKNSGQHSAARNGKVEWDIVEYSTTFLFSADWLYFLWHGINHKYKHSFVVDFLLYFSRVD